MNKTEFLSLGMYDKLKRLEEIIREKGIFDEFCVIDYTEEKVIVATVDDEAVHYYAADYAWIDDDNYALGNFKRVIHAYKEIKDDADPSPIFDEQSDDPSKETSEEEPKDTDLAAKEDKTDCAADDKEKCEASKEREKCELPEEENSDSEEKEKDGESASSSEEGNDKDKDADFKTNESEKEKEKSENSPESFTSDFTAFSDEDRAELEALRREKKERLLKTFESYLDAAILEDFKAKLDTVTYNELEMQLKVKAFESLNTKIMNSNATQNTFNVILPEVDTPAEYSSSLDRTVAKVLKRQRY